jgi:hypothetical protein
MYRCTLFRLLWRGQCLKCCKKSNKVFIAKVRYFFEHALFMCVYIYFFFSCGASIRFQVTVSPYGASLTHSDTPDPVGLLWTSDQPDAETCTWQHSTHILVPCAIRTRNPSKPAAAIPGLRPRGCCDRLILYVGCLIALEHVEKMSVLIKQSSPSCSNLP